MTYPDLTPDEYLGLLEKGLGRAVLYLQSHDAAPYRDAILHACTHDLRFEPISQCGRGRYLSKVVMASGEPARFVADVVEALRPCADPDGAQQMISLIEGLREDGIMIPDTAVRAPIMIEQMRLASEPRHDFTWADLAGRLAAMGDEEARRALYAVFERTFAAGREYGARDIIWLDGMDGFLRVARAAAARANTELDIWIQRVWLDDLAARCGECGTIACIREAMADEQAALQWLDTVLKQLDIGYPGREDHSGKRRLSYGQCRVALRKVLRSGRVSPANGMTVARLASAAALVRLADDVVAARDTDGLAALLTVFTHTPFPLPHSHLIALVRHPDEAVRHSAVGALGQIEHEEVCAMALDLLSRPGYTVHALEILCSNAREGDHLLVEEVLRRDLDPDTMHRAELDSLTFYKDNPDQPCLDGLTLLYERGPCSFCRNTVVEMLIKRSLLPDWMREECRYDCEPDTRKAVQ